MRETLNYAKEKKKHKKSDRKQTNLVNYKMRLFITYFLFYCKSCCL